MSHHGSEPFDGIPEDPERKIARNKLMRDLLSSATNFKGALGDFPEGQLTKTDEGAIQFAIGEKDGKVVVDFGTPVHWLGMTPQQAADFASLLLKRARAVGRATGQTVGFTIG
ncbi:hypothetical protein H8A97_12895 [Bradyrhizobium sp. Arg62]|uniref:hypothetical protein n=1 Tax=Bradyrhizobium brasilense TaxID=1419277 RepID=UPI001E2A6257|nr:hypothetical protein [Bradyrhizobium brasilense]MCC8945970.1 hypothetical protein [Bradyrhizobium brasilense]